ncbi:prepilin-type N-terminal cleavage/methylation domain-containing protein [Orenia metallireducens]|jgi:prepilin-type N-terminal cleavage/methylation domain-containing protein|uniref:Prepilin-type N-terminal cleavage/methylation domain-containing protein n=1 Tax=Orenia metallireducens TaxID=1413210 RepID=A0A285GGY4_9FIRM|nr:type II secretion system protein [Orenia metallireducens]PRX30487.1 prepilin-type N-terminal cleavage/methylation domain-containing protein [Orenia metallireducens]SNY22829.1 prepilin-type N-terminal cleavage/methylation domain-containing protein [Orenia metallireducens]
MDRGFTLIEVLIAMLILGISLSILVQGFMGVNDGIERRRDYTYMASWSESKLNEIVSGVELATHGDFLYKGNLCSWSLEEDYIDEGVRGLKLIVRWLGSKGEYSYSVSRITLNDDWE